MVCLGSSGNSEHDAIRAQNYCPILIRFFETSFNFRGVGSTPFKIGVFNTMKTLHAQVKPSCPILLFETTGTWGATPWDMGGHVPDVRISRDSPCPNSVQGHRLSLVCSMSFLKQYWCFFPKAETSVDVKV